VAIDYGQYVDFTNVAVERKLEARTIRTDDVAGWGFEELDQVQSEHVEDRRAERDALRLLAVLLNHWDNRADNQRLVCLEDGSRSADGGCRAPFAYLQDVGGSFGRVGGAKAERKLHLDGWRAVPIWKDGATCRVEIEAPALHGATFDEAVISEAGRAFLASRLRRVTARHVRDLFEGAGFDDYPGPRGRAPGVRDWVEAYEDKVRQIVAREPCPTP
jgi:hypothetical protein